MVDIVSNRNCVYQTAYHLIWCPKYRRDILVGPIATETANMLDLLSAEHGWPVISKEIQPDHIHLFVSIPPSVAAADAVKILKGTTARRLFQTFPEFRKRLWGGHLWSPSYYVGTAGNISAETVRRCIERSAHLERRR
jgi:putative transposase